MDNDKKELSMLELLRNALTLEVLPMEYGTKEEQIQTKSKINLIIFISS